MSNHDFSPLTMFEQMELVTNAIKSATAHHFQMKKYDISPDQWKIMHSASTLDVPTQSNISDNTDKDPAAVTRMVSILLKKGFVEKKKQKEDKRSHHILLTRKGKTLAKKVGPAVEKIMKKAMDKVSSRDASTVRRITQTVADNLSSK